MKAASFFTIATVSLCFSAVVATAQSNEVSARQQAMKEIGQSMRTAARMATGRTEWSSADAKKAMATVEQNAARSVALFDKRGSGSEALPAVWSNKADFDARLRTLQSLAKKAGEADSAASYKAAFAKVSRTCKGCHDTYRAD